MPREYVYSEAWRAAEQGITGVNTEFQMAASVGWSKEENGGYVQLATIRNGSEHSFDPCDGLYMTMDRRQINELIRLLRKARDQAYGRDE